MARLLFPPGWLAYSDRFTVRATDTDRDMDTDTGRGTGKESPYPRDGAARMCVHAARRRQRPTDRPPADERQVYEELPHARARILQLNVEYGATAHHEDACQLF